VRPSRNDAGFSPRGQGAKERDSGDLGTVARRVADQYLRREPSQIVTVDACLISQVSHFDPSWCARINAHRQPSAPPPRPQTPAPDSAGKPASSPPEPTPFRLREIPREHTCELCGTAMYDHNCKIVCPNCGYKRDCSDP
jgi:hypothetical protein